MKVLIRSVVIYLCFSVAFGSDVYRAGVVRGLHSYTDLETYPGYLRDAANAKLDVLLLSPPEAYSSIKSNEGSYGLDNYDELVKLLSGVSKSANCYLVAHLLDNNKCQNRRELVRTNVVFNRRGEIVAEHRKPLSTQANCTSTSASVGSFETDFGVTVGVMMEEDLVLERGDLRGLQHFVVAGGLTSNIPFLSASQFSSSWAFVHKASVVSPAGIFGGGHAKSAGNLMVADLEKLVTGDRTFVSTLASEATSAEDLSMYVVRPLDLSVRGFRQTVCHDEFCCEFYVKAKSEGSQVHNMHFGLSAFSGVREYSHRHDIGAQTCAIFPCAGVAKLAKGACGTGFNSNNTVTFEKISVTGNFTGSTQYPFATSETPRHVEFKSETIGKTNRVILVADNIKVSSFGIFGADHSRDSVKYSGDVSNEEYVFSDQMHELFDYMWIRLRILIFVVSIYVLEML